jgi:hypothetical protein
MTIEDDAQYAFVRAAVYTKQLVEPSLAYCAAPLTVDVRPVCGSGDSSIKKDTKRHGISCTWRHDQMNVA